jgi:outer membrane lipoprotein-sorting protein
MKSRTSRKNHWGLRASVAALLTCSAALFAGAPSAHADDLTASDILAKTRAAYAALSSYSESGRATMEMAGQTLTLTFELRLQRPNLYRVVWTPGMTPGGEVWSDGTGHYLLSAKPGPGAAETVQTQPSMKQALAKAGALSWSAAAVLPEAFFQQDCGDLFVAPVLSGRYPLTREADAAVGNVECFVVSCTLDMSQVPGKTKPGTNTATLWVDKQDFLLRQTRTRYVEKVDPKATVSDQAVDAAIKKTLEAQHKPVTPEAIAALRPQMKATMKQVQSTITAGFTAGLVFTQTHEAITVNQKFSPADFTR